MVVVTKSLPYECTVFAYIFHNLNNTSILKPAGHYSNPYFIGGLSYIHKERLVQKSHDKAA